jgi:hypothetical protein
MNDYIRSAMYGAYNDFLPLVLREEKLIFGRQTLLTFRVPVAVRFCNRKLLWESRRKTWVSFDKNLQQYVSGRSFSV